MAEIDEGLFKEFMEFVTAKQQAAAENDDGDEEVEIWDDKGRGARVKKRDAKPFLQSLGLMPDPKPETETNDTDQSASKSRPTGRTSTASQATSVAKRYFTKSVGK